MTELETLKATIENKKKAIAECIEVCKKYGVDFVENFEYDDEWAGGTSSLDFVIDTTDELDKIHILNNTELFNSLVKSVKDLEGLELCWHGKKVLKNVESYELKGGLVYIKSEFENERCYGNEERNYSICQIIEAIENK